MKGGVIEREEKREKEEKNVNKLTSEKERPNQVKRQMHRNENTRTGNPKKENTTKQKQNKTKT